MREEPQKRRARVQAKTVRVRDTFVAEQFGAAARERFVAAASPPLRELLGTTGEPKGGWVEFALFVEANTLADSLFGRGDLALAWEMGRFAATHNMGVWRSMLMRHVRPSTFIGIAAGLWGSHYDGGKLLSRSVGDGGLLVSIADFPEPHRAHCLAIAGWVHGSLEIGPRRNVRVVEQSCRLTGGATCDLDIRWE